MFTRLMQTRSPLRLEQAFPKPRIFELLDVYRPGPVADLHDIHALRAGENLL